ncbi:DUF2971 domain-containing protein [Ralstonia sp. CHL-2022]|uniref:DUF2971 domain-containing protein n=1 Tax=Ralstonia mojiangensis TaxID=2953895 RepID=A0AAE3I3G3_9RALS|nr:DUF2971 domain-containing protein [Ralstonia mojiangensis]MCT7316720.1 DUF2971 domain-containing protein [Ralstonia mojiangensis]
MTPEILYKYRDDSENTEKIFTNKKIWLSTAKGLNDPLECRTGQIPLSWQNEKIHDLESAQLMGFVGFPAEPPTTLFSLSPRETKRYWKKFKELSRNNQIKSMRSMYAKHGIQISNPQRIFSNFEKQLSRIGIFSLTEQPLDPLMWAHYAESHKGLALGFYRTKGTRLADPRHTMKVTYDPEKPTFTDGFLQQIRIGQNSQGTQVSYAGMSFDDPVFRAAFSTKPPEWQYEKEWRYVEETAGLHEWPGTLVSVIFGCKMPKDRRNHYKKLVESSAANVTFHEVKINSGNEFELVKLFQ